LKHLKYFFLTLVFLLLVGCATSQDLRALRSEMNQKMDDKLSAIETNLNALKKSTESLETLRSNQANTTADLADLRENLQQLRGQIESLKKEFSANAKKDDQRFENILLKINFIENFWRSAIRTPPVKIPTKTANQPSPPLLKRSPKKAKKTRLTPQLIRLSRTEITTKPEPNFKIS